MIKQKISSIRVDRAHTTSPRRPRASRPQRVRPAAISIIIIINQQQQTRDSTRHEKTEEEQYHASMEEEEDHKGLDVTCNPG
jgi:hypothetical protein